MCLKHSQQPHFFNLLLISQENSFNRFCNIFIELKHVQHTSSTSQRIKQLRTLPPRTHFNLIITHNSALSKALYRLHTLKPLVQFTHLKKPTQYCTPLTGDFNCALRATLCTPYYALKSLHSNCSLKYIGVNNTPPIKRLNHCVKKEAHLTSSTYTKSQRASFISALLSNKVSVQPTTLSAQFCLIKQCTSLNNIVCYLLYQISTSQIVPPFNNWVVMTSPSCYIIFFVNLERILNLCQSQ